MISATKCNYLSLTGSAFRQGWTLGQILFNTFNKDLDDGMDCLHSRFLSDTKLGGTTVTLKGSAAIWKDLCILDKRADGNLIKFNTGKCNVLRQVWNSFTGQDGHQLSKKQFCRKAPGSPVGQVACESAACPCLLLKVQSGRARGKGYMLKHREFPLGIKNNFFTMQAVKHWNKGPEILWNLYP